MEPNPPTALKIIMLGTSGVGKTSLLNRYLKGTFQEVSLIMTMRLDIIPQSISVDNQDRTVYWYDTVGQERFQSLSKDYYRNSHGIIFVYDIQERDTLNDIKKYIEVVMSVTGRKEYSETARMLVANMCDMHESAAISTTEGKNFAEQNGMTFAEVSCKTGENVNEAMETFIEKVVAIDKDRENEGTTTPANDRQTVRLHEERRECNCC